MNRNGRSVWHGGGMCPPDWGERGGSASGIRVLRAIGSCHIMPLHPPMVGRKSRSEGVQRAHGGPVARHGTPVHMSPLMTTGGHDGHSASERDVLGSARGVGESAQASFGTAAVARCVVPSANGRTSSRNARRTSSELRWHRGRGGSIRSDVFPSMRRARLLPAFAPALVDMARDQNRRERAVVWLGAFEDELTRRHRLSGRAARRWQRERQLAHMAGARHGGLAVR